MKKINLLYIIIAAISIAFFTILFIEILLLGYIKSMNVKTENDYFLSHAKILAEKNMDTTQEHARDTSQKVQVVHNKIFFLNEKNLTCYSGEAFVEKNIIDDSITRFLVYRGKLYYIKKISWEESILFECEISGKNPKVITKNVTDFTVKENIILYTSIQKNDTLKITEQRKDTGEKKILYNFENYSDYGGNRIIFYDERIILAGNDTIGVYDKNSKKYENFLQDDFDYYCTVSPFVFDDNCYISIVYYDGDYDMPIPPVNREKTGIWRFDFQQNKLIKVSSKHARYSEIVGGKLTLYHEFTFSPYPIILYLRLTNQIDEPNLF